MGVLLAGGSGVCAADQVCCRQAGLVGVLLTRFRATLALNAAYLAISIGLHSWSLNRQWEDPYLLVWTPGLLALYATHRIGETKIFVSSPVSVCSS